MSGNQKKPITRLEVKTAFNELPTATTQETEQTDEIKLPDKTIKSIDNYHKVVVATHNQFAGKLIANAFTGIISPDKIQLDNQYNYNDPNAINVLTNKLLQDGIQSIDLIAIEGNLGNGGNAATCIPLIEKILVQNPNAIVIIVTDTPSCAQEILEKFPHHHVFWRTTTNGNPFPEEGQKHLQGKYFFQNKMVEFLQGLAAPDPSSSLPPSEASLVSPSDVISPSSVNHHHTSSTASPVDISSPTVSEIYSPSSANSPVSSATSPQSSNKATTTKTERFSIKARILPQPTVEPSSKTPRPTSADSQPGCFPWFRRIGKRGTK